MENKITIIATQLAIKHSDDADIPIRHRRKSNPAENAKTKVYEAIELRFNENVQSWRNLIHSVLGHLDTAQAWRFITTSPIVSPSYVNVVDCPDFLEFNGYLARRRDEDKCSDSELGQLSLLLTELQSTIENRISAATSG